MPETRRRTRQQSRQHAEADARTDTEQNQHEVSHSAAEDDHDENSEEDEDEVVLSEHFTGTTDARSNLPHGRGTLTVDFQRGRRRGRNVFTGSFSHGLKSANVS